MPRALPPGGAADSAPAAAAQPQAAGDAAKQLRQRVFTELKPDESQKASWSRCSTMCA